VNDEKVEILSDELSEGDVVYVQESTVNTWTGRNGMPGGGGMGGMPGAGGQGGRSGGSGQSGRSGGSGSGGGSRR